jgi:16S rRNA processing protein RimM
VIEPDDLLVVAKLHGSFGLKGWVHVEPLSGNIDTLKKNSQWWLRGASVVGEAQSLPLRCVAVVDAKPHGSGMVVLFEDVVTPEQAAQFRQTEVLLPRSSFAKPGLDEYYWVDLVGCDVVNIEGLLLGRVAQVDDHGAHAFLIVEPASRPEPHLIPFVNQYVLEVSLQQKQIKVDWQNDY